MTSTPSTERKARRTRNTRPVRISDNESSSDSVSEIESDTPVKRRKTERVESRRRLDNSLYDSLVDPEIPLEDVTGGTVRMLEYDPNNGLLQVLNLVVKAAGCATSAQLTAPEAAAADLQAATKEYAPARYLLVSNRDFSRRYTEFFTTIVSELAQSDMLSAYGKLLQYFQSFAGLQLRSVRHTASTALFSGATALATAAAELESALDRRSARHVTDLRAQLDQLSNLRSSMVSTAIERCKDVFGPIRESAALAVGVLDPALLGPKLLNDESPAVRLATLKYFVPKSSQWKRVLEIAQRDVDARCRRQAVRVLENAPPQTAEQAASLITDADAGVRLAAATLAVHKAPEPEPQLKKYGLDPQWRLLLSLAPPPSAPEVIAALAKAGKFTLASAISLALQDWSRVKVSREDREWADEMAKEPLDCLVAMIYGIGKYEWEELQRRPGSSDDKLERCSDFAAQVLEAVPRLLSKFAGTDELADVAHLVILADFGSIVRRGYEPVYEQVLVQILQAFAAQPTRKFAAVVQQILAAAYDSPLSAAVAAEAQRFYDEQRSRDPPSLAAIAVLAPHVDISDMADSPDWDATTPGAVELATALGMFYPEAARKAAECLATTKAAEELLKVYIVASVRQISLPELPELDLDSVSPRTLAAAKAASVI